jgi:V/A-type H+/Na+-transporting ATPase subunit C
MKSRLLGRRELDNLAETGSLEGLIAALTKTPYQRSVEASLTRFTGMQCIDGALRNDLIWSIGKIRGFFREETKKTVAMILISYDIHNLKAILRGLSKNVPAGDILSALLPIGELDINTLRELAQLNNPREAIDLAASMGLKFSSPLVGLRVEIPGAEIFEMELTLDKWYFKSTFQVLLSETGSVDLISQALKLDADIANILTVLRFAQYPKERDSLQQRFGTTEITHLMIGPGRIHFNQLENAAQQDTVGAAIEALGGTYLISALQAGFDAYTHSDRLSDIEKQLRHYRLKWMAGNIPKDPLGIGVVLGYIALKVNEIGNLRWITHGINLGLKTDVIKADLETIA